MNVILSLIPILLPAVTGILLLALRPKNSWKISLAASVLTAVSLIPALTGSVGFSVPVGRSLEIALAADGLGAFFLVLIALGFACAVCYAGEYLAGDRRQPLFFGFTLLTLGAMMGLAMAGNMVTFYMFYEMMSLASFPLVLYSGEEKARKAAFSYLGFSVFGASLALMGMLMGGAVTLRSFAQGAQIEALSGKLLWAALLMLVGFSCKAGMMPLANWLPTAHPEAPAPASALLSGIITKAGILGMIRTAYFLFGAENLVGTFPQTVVLILAVVTIFAGSMLAYKERHLKKRLAYSSVSQLSYVIFGLMMLSPAGLCAGLMQVVFHACAKVGLFLCAGAFIHHAKANYVDELTGMGRKMPGVMMCFTCFSLSLIGIPPFGGFVSKWMLADAALSQGSMIAGIGVIVLMVSALLTAGYLLPIVARGWFPGEGFEAKKHDAGAAMLLPLGILAALAAVLGLLPEGIVSYLTAACANLF